MWQYFDVICAYLKAAARRQKFSKEDIITKTNASWKWGSRRMWKLSDGCQIMVHGWGKRQKWFQKSYSHVNNAVPIQMIASIYLQWLRIVLTFQINHWWLNMLVSSKVLSDSDLWRKQGKAGRHTLFIQWVQTKRSADLPIHCHVWQASWRTTICHMSVTKTDFYVKTMWYTFWHEKTVTNCCKNALVKYYFFQTIPQNTLKTVKTFRWTY